MSIILNIVGVLCMLMAILSFAAWMKSADESYSTLCLNTAGVFLLAAITAFGFASVINQLG